MLLSFRCAHTSLFHAIRTRTRHTPANFDRKISYAAALTYAGYVKQLLILNAGPRSTLIQDVLDERSSKTSTKAQRANDNDSHKPAPSYKGFKDDEDGEVSQESWEGGLSEMPQEEDIDDELLQGLHSWGFVVVKSVL